MKNYPLNFELKIYYARIGNYEKFDYLRKLKNIN